jgi:hypothetical protein
MGDPTGDVDLDKDLDTDLRPLAPGGAPYGPGPPLLPGRRGYPAGEGLLLPYRLGGPGLYRLPGGGPGLYRLPGGGGLLLLYRLPGGGGLRLKLRLYRRGGPLYCPPL